MKKQAPKKSHPKILGIHFTDNDFYNTFRGFLTILMQEGLEAYPADKESLVELFNQSSAGLYLLFQDQGRDGKIPEASRLQEVSEYLKLDTKNIYLDEEVADFIQNNPYGFNHEFHVLDTQVFKPYIYTV